MTTGKIKLNETFNLTKTKYKQNKTETDSLMASPNNTDHKTAMKVK